MNGQRIKRIEQMEDSLQVSYQSAQSADSFIINMRKFLSCLFFFIFSLWVSFCSAKDLSSVYMFGVRMGFWSALDAKNIHSSPYYEVLTKVTAPYGEFFISNGLKKGFAFEFSAGSYYRGETRYNDSLGYYWKRVTIYPVSFVTKYYPLSSPSNNKWQPYLDAGISFVSGVENLRLGEYAGSLTLVGDYTDTYLTLGWFSGVGMDFVLSRLFVLGLDFKYRWVNFGKQVGGLKDYSGPEATLGLSYILKGM
jgi:outer membrane protein W